MPYTGYFPFIWVLFFSGLLLAHCPRNGPTIRVISLCCCSAGTSLSLSCQPVQCCLRPHLASLPAFLLNRSLYTSHYSGRTKKSVKLGQHKDQSTTHYHPEENTYVGSEISVLKFVTSLSKFKFKSFRSVRQGYPDFRCLMTMWGCGDVGMFNFYSGHILHIWSFYFVCLLQGNRPPPPLDFCWKFGPGGFLSTRRHHGTCHS